MKTKLFYQRSESRRFKLEQTEIEAEIAYGGILSLTAAQRAFNIVKDFLEVGGSWQDLSNNAEENLYLIKEKYQRYNYLLLMYGLAVTNEIPNIFNYCVNKLGN